MRYVEFMNKIDGLKLLEENFPDITLNSLFIDEIDGNALDNLKRIRNSPDKFWRVRSACRIGKELKLPMGSFYNEIDALQFIQYHKKRNSNLSFVLHCIDNDYYYPEFTGTLAVYNNDDFCSIVIELQKTPRELIDKMDSGIRPRDWPICVNYHYQFLHKRPIIKLFDEVDMEFLKIPVNALFKIGCRIYGIYENRNWNTTSYTRFNIYRDGSIILNDHRTIESFI